MTDREIVRDLAKQVAELANEPRIVKLKDEWIAHNDLHPNARPLILAQPDASCWDELVPTSGLKCKEPRFRQYERNLQKDIYGMKYIKDDAPYTATFPVPYATKISAYGPFVAEAEKTEVKGGSYHYKKLIDNIEEDFDKLEFRTITHDAEASAKAKNAAEEVFGDILNVEYRGEQCWTYGITWEVIKLIGLEDLMLNMYDDPEGLHKLMGWFTQEHLNFLQQMKNLGILNPNHKDIAIGSGGYGWTEQLLPADWDRSKGLDTMQKWGFSESQETVGISPDMFAEFIFPYQLPILEKFGLNNYGCCEPLEGRWKYVSQIPRLRRVSVSPWSDIYKMRDLLKKDYIYSRKVSPSYFCVGFEEEALKRELNEIFSIAKDIQLEVILKDVRTVQNDPTRFAKWVQMAREAAAK
ncbi:hypothetical protein [Candidatus Epulonipiscium viviparus]|uniref:hypothetical protein n=1 Tax=Candidatus Epulonipiscium viviparus TaxID=420336 RepID=UPI0027381689|nr:hypothetical protein [Candidatus Epulopiscium viviparus]